jgi:hypothetical protein
MIWRKKFNKNGLFLLNAFNYCYDSIASNTFFFQSSDYCSGRGHWEYKNWAKGPLEGKFTTTLQTTWPFQWGEQFLVLWEVGRNRKLLSDYEINVAKELHKSLSLSPIPIHFSRLKTYIIFDGLLNFVIFQKYWELVEKEKICQTLESLKVNVFDLYCIKVRRLGVVEQK